jgi:hypothetical protein
MEPITEKDLEAVADVVDGHPVAASQAITYITQVLAPDSSRSPAQEFVDIMRSRNHKNRMPFLEYKWMVAGLVAALRWAGSGVGGVSAFKGCGGGGLGVGC